MCVCVLVLRHRHLYVRHAEANLSGIWWVSVTKIAPLLEEISSQLGHAKYSKRCCGAAINILSQTIYENTLTKAKIMCRTILVSLYNTAHVITLDKTFGNNTF